MLIGTDRTIFTPGSAVRARIARFGQGYTEGLDSIVFAVRAYGATGAQELAPGVHAYPTNSRSRLLYGLDALRIVRHLPRPDAVSAQDPFETGLVALLIARYWRVPLMIEMHTDFLSPSFVRHSLLNRLRVLIAGFVLRHAQGGYTVSNILREKVLKRYRLTVPLGVLPIYVDTQRFSVITHRKHPRFTTSLLWVGRMEKEKNPELALGAFIAARREGYAVGLTFVGGGHLLKALKEKASCEGVGEWVEFTGAVSNPVPYYTQADLLLVTSIFEGYGMVIIEALAARVPVLSTDVGIAREAGAFIASDDQDKYAEALILWLKGPRQPGILKLQSYVNEGEYMEHIQELYTARIGQNTLL